MATAGPYDRNAFRICVAHAVRDGVQALKKALADTEGRLLRDQQAAASDKREQDGMGDALALLRTHRSTLVQAYPIALMEHLAGASLAGAPTGAQARAGGGQPAWDSLTLMDDAQVLAQVELSRAQQLVTHATEAVLAELDRLMSAAQGLPRVVPERNPLRPENFLRALQQVVSDSGVPEATRQRWMRHLPDLLGQRLVVVYQRAAARLSEGGVRPVSYGVAAAGDRIMAAAGTGQGALHAVHHGPALGEELSGFGATALQGVSSTLGMPLGSDTEALLTVAMLQQMLDELGAERVAATGFHGGVTGAGALVIATGPSGRMPVGGASPPTLAAIDAQAIAQQEAESDAVVAEMMRRIASDERLLPTLRRALQRIEPPIRRIARLEPSFFTDERHPARRLLDELTDRSLAYTAEDTPGFTRFVRLLNGAVKHLNAAEPRNAKPFKAVLRALHKAWEALAQETEAQRAQADAELLQREQKAVLARAVAHDIRRMPGAAQMPADLLAFATGPWAEVVAQSQMRAPGEPGSDASGYLTLVPVLLTCTQPDQVEQDPAAVVRAIADLLPTVREGLRSIGHPETETDAVLERLAGLAPVLATASAESPAGDAATSAAAQPLDATPPMEEPEAVVDAHDPGAGAAAALEASAVDSTDNALAAAAAAQATVPQPSQTQQLPAPQPLPDYALGQWVELSRDRQVVRTQLTWCSPNGALFLFTAADGSTQSMTRRMRDRLVAEGALRSIDTPPPTR